MAIKKSQLYSTLWSGCDELRGGMDASQYKDYVLVMLFIKYISDKYAGQPYAPITIPEGASFKDMVALKGKSDIGDQINKKIIAPLAQANQLSDFPDFNDAAKLGSGKEMVDRLTNLIGIFENPDLDFAKHRAADDDLLGDAYEYLMRHFATESGKSKGQFYTPAEVSRIMAQILGIHEAETRASTTVYDPTCGSGSLLLKVADEAQTRVTLEGQEKDVSTAGLARLNMILHDNPEAVIKGGASTLANPLFKVNGELKTYDYVVANPPFSDKRWSTGFDPLNDPYNRFDGFGLPPAKQGDYAYLLHIVRSLKSTGTGACILPHGVLFRGHAEAEIRRNLVRKGYIKGIIGLPANLFYGTGIPACIVVVDKQEAANRNSIFMINAANGFMKDGPKNRLRAQDIHKIVDVFNRQEEVEGFSKMVSLEEIGERNEYNLNLPRYIDNRQAEDIQDIAGHLQGGIPVADIDALQEYWEVCPSLRESLFNENRSGYVDLAVDKTDIKSAIYKHPEFVAFIGEMNQHFDQWRVCVAAELRDLTVGARPKEVIRDLSEDLLAHYKDRPLINPYDVYQHLMDYWSEDMQDDLHQIAAEGWTARTRPNMVAVKSGKKKGQEVEKGWICDLVPQSLVVERYFSEQQAEIDQFSSEREATEASLSELDDENSGDEGALRDVSNKTDAQVAWQEALKAAWEDLLPDSYRDYQSAVSTAKSHSEALADLEKDHRLQALQGKQGRPTKTNVNKRLKATDDPDEASLLTNYLATLDEVKAVSAAAQKLSDSAESELGGRMEADPDNETLDDLRVVGTYLRLTEQIADLKKQIKEAEAILDEAAYNKYPELSEDEVKSLVIDDKWLARFDSDVHGELDRISQSLSSRVKELGERYGTPLPRLSDHVAGYEGKVAAHLRKMGFDL